MPEGHTLHRLAGSLEAAFRDTAPRASSPQGRFAEGAALLDGRPFLGARAWGKHLFVDVAGDVALHVHLGLIGRFDVVDCDGDAPPPPVGAVRLRLLGEHHVADLRGATVCELVTPPEVDRILARLGPDPLRRESDPERAWRRISASTRPVADLLMDQSVLAGVGNVYRSEVLFRLRLDPHRPGRQLRRSSWETVWSDLGLLMPLGVELGQIVTMSDQVEDALAKGYDETLVPAAASGVSAWRPNPSGALERRYYVYRRAGEACRVCGARVRSEVLAGRLLYWCGRCQRRR